MPEVVILGGGFGGIAVVNGLRNACQRNMLAVTLVDHNSYHTFTPSLYEVATAESPQKNIAIPLHQFVGKNIRCITGKVAEIRAGNKTVQLTNGSLISYDILVIALGSQTAYFGIPGLEKYSAPLKTIGNAVAIRKQLLAAMQQASEEDPKTIIIGGGGFTGVEFAAEVAALQARTCQKYKKPASTIKLSLVEGMPRLLNGLDVAVSEKAQQRLSTAGVSLLLGNNIQAVTKNTIVTADGTEHHFDLFIWTGGVAANAILQSSSLPTNKKGQVIVDEALAVVGFDKMFAVGDAAGYTDAKTQKPAPWLAQTAEDQGSIVANNIVATLKNHPKRRYQLKNYWYIVPLKGRWAIAVFGSWKITGLAGWFLQQLAYLRYLLRILPFPRALKKWNTFELEQRQ